MRALLLGILVFRNCYGQSGDGSSSGIRNVTTSFDIVTETKITYDPLLLDKTSNTYQTNRDRVIDETQPGLEAAAARVSATLISIDVLFSTDSSSFSARRRRQASQTVYTQITPTLNIIETNPDVPQFELASVQEVEQEMNAVVASASTGSVFVRNATVQTGAPTSSSVEVPADFPIYGDQTSDGDFPIATTTTSLATTTTTKAATTTTTIATPSGTQPQDFPIYDDDSIEIIEDNSDNSGLFPVVTDPATTTPAPTTTTKTTTTKTSTVNPGTPPTGFPIYDDDEIPITVDVDGLFPVVTDDNSAAPNTTTTEQTTTTKSTTTTTFELPDDFPIYEDQGPNGDFPINDDNTTSTAEQTTTSTSTSTSTSTLTVESETTAEPTTVSDSTQSVSLGTTAEPETTKSVEPETTTEETWNSGSQTILSICLLLASLTIF